MNVISNHELIKKSYVTYPQNSYNRHLNNLIEKIVKCKPLFIVLGVISTLALFIPMAESYAIKIASTSTEFIPDDVQIIPIAVAEAFDNLQNAPRFGIN